MPAVIMTKDKNKIKKLHIKQKVSGDKLKSKKSLLKPTKKFNKNKNKEKEETILKPKKAVSSNEENEDSFSEENDSENNQFLNATGENVSDSESENEEQNTNEFNTHKKSLAKLKETDPEFYKFLQDNDKKLLNFHASDSENEDENSDEEDEEGLHKPSDKLEVASDESDFEAEDGRKYTKSSGKVTLKLLQQWQNDLLTDTSVNTISNVVKAFNAALLSVSDDKSEKSEFAVGGAAVFNGVIQLCVLYLQPAIKRFLKIAPGSKQPPHKCKRFTKIKVVLKNYFGDLVKLLSGVTSSNILNVLLKHIHQMCPMLVSYSKIAKVLLKKLIKVWGTQEDNVRVVAFLCILRITNHQRATYLDFVLKKMYMTYVKNSKFVSPSTLAGINFMRRSLVEMYGLDLNFAYQHVFLYIRQLAIHLRNAITLKKKENIQAVYNWQFVNSLHLWGELLANTSHKPQLEPLIYPLVAISLGTIKLIPTAQYYPLRFHCIEILIELSRDSGRYIPILPFLTEILSTYDFNKKHKKVSMKPLQFDCILRLSKSQLSENGFKDAVADSIYGLLVQYLASESHLISFPDLVLPLLFELKKFIKNCSVANYCKKFKQLLEKIEENSKFIENERKSFTYLLSEKEKINGWESQIKNKGTPLMKFYENWNTLNQIKKSKRETKNDEIADYNLPVLNRKKRPLDEKPSEEGQVELFPSDDDEEDDDDLNILPKAKRTKRGRKLNKKEKVINPMETTSNEEADVVKDLNLSDW